jgi:hypothetical protein
MTLPSDWFGSICTKPKNHMFYNRFQNFLSVESSFGEKKSDNNGMPISSVFHMKGQLKSVSSIGDLPNG